MSEETLQGIVGPFLGDVPVPPSLISQLCVYLDLLLRWNERTNLTAIREPEEIVRRHFGESLFLGKHLPPCSTLLDYGSGAGFPGLPIQLLFPDLNVTLAESQGKKASFLREAVRSLRLGTEVWPYRVEDMDPRRYFDIVALRAVDRMKDATKAARERVSPGGTLALLMTGTGDGLAVPESHNRIIRLIPKECSTWNTRFAQDEAPG